MPKRFSASEKWDKEWFQQLHPRLKCFWQYLCDRCDHAGIWEANYGLASYMIGEQVTAADIAAFGGRVEVLPCGKVFISDFVKFQYGKLEKGCKPHDSVIRRLEEFELFERVSKGLANGFQTVQGKDKDKDKDKEKECIELANDTPMATDEFLRIWSEWVLFRMKMKKCKDWRALFAKQLEWLRPMNADDRIEIISQSMRNGWQGLFERKQSTLQKQKGGDAAAESPAWAQLEQIEKLISEFTARNPNPERWTDIEREKLKIMRMKRKTLSERIAGVAK